MKNKNMAKGSIFVWVVISLLILLLFISIAYWYFRDSWEVYTPEISSKVLFKTPAPKFKVPGNWKIYENPPLNISLKIPNGWYRNEDLTVTQYSIPRSPKKGAVYNIVSISRHTGVLISGYYDQDLFNKIYNLERGGIFTPQFFNNSNQRMVQISKGETLGDKRYVVFNVESESVVNSEKMTEVWAFVLDGNSIIIFKITNYDEFGLKAFQQIVSTTKLGTI